MGKFPSVAAAWRISDEAFMKNVEALSNLKLRLSWGKTGNSGIMAYGTQSGLTPKTNSAFRIMAIPIIYTMNM